MPALTFKQVDVFTRVPFRGNPVAVVLDAAGLETPQMQAIANWTNLSETTFVLPPSVEEADYRLRIFTPGRELPFAGHPTIGTAHALLEAGVIHARGGLLVQQCEAGLIPLTVEEDREGRRSIAFQLPKARFTPLSESLIDELEALLGASINKTYIPNVVDVGPRWLVAQLDKVSELLAIRPDFPGLLEWNLRHQHTGVTLFAPQEAGADTSIELRSFVPAHGVNEDPVCGSGTGSAAAFIQQSGQQSRFGTDFLASQGACLGRSGRLSVRLLEDRVYIGGAAVTCVNGTLSV